ncbi:MAG: type II CAAX endopeptidase family protein [Bacteroidales bacterium]
METLFSVQKEELEITVNGPNDENVTSREDRIPFRSLLPFSLITFGISWVVIALYVFLPEPMVRLFGQLTGSHPFFYLAVWSPAIAAFSIIIRKCGFKGIKAFIKGLSLWRAPWGWYVFLLLGIPVIFFAGVYLNGSLFTEPLPYQTFAPALIAIALALIKGPVEEFGWRGFALPLLQRRVAPIWAALIIGTIWGLWHTPAFLLSGTQQSQWDFAPFFLGCIAISVIISALFNATKGSILLCAFLHFNLMNPLWPEAQPYDTFLLFVVAVIVVWIYRKSMFHREGGIKRVIPAN